MPSTCPNCGADVPPKARACPECGSDEQTGWSDSAQSSGLDLPDDSFNYDQFVQKEFGGKKSSPSGLPWIWWLTALLVISALVLLLIW